MKEPQIAIDGSIKKIYYIILYYNSQYKSLSSYCWFKCDTTCIKEPKNNILPFTFETDRNKATRLSHDNAIICKNYLISLMKNVPYKDTLIVDILPTDEYYIHI